VGNAGINRKTLDLIRQFQTLVWIETDFDGLSCANQRHSRISAKWRLQYRKLSFNLKVRGARPFDRCANCQNSVMRRMTEGQHAAQYG
jgi:hypothetical protein